MKCKLGRMEAELKKKERFVLEEIQVKEEQKQRILQNIAAEAKQKHWQYTPSLWEIFKGQLKYISAFCLGGQAVCMLTVILLLGYFQERGGNTLTYLGVFSVAASYVGVFLLMELSRSRDYGTMELEQSCYLNLKQVWCIKMILFGCLDFVMFTVMILGIAGNTSCGAFRSMVYLLVPFVISNSVQLWVFTILRGGRREYLQMGTGILAGGVSLIPLSNPQWYSVEYFGIWVLALAGSLGFFAREARQIYHKLEEGEIVCWS